MTARELKRYVEQELGFTFVRRGKGDHLIYQKGDIRITIPDKKMKPGLVKLILCQARGTFAKNRRIERPHNRKLQSA